MVKEDYSPVVSLTRCQATLAYPSASKALLRRSGALQPAAQRSNLSNQHQQHHGYSTPALLP